MVVPGGGSQINSFRVRLPGEALERDGNRLRYRLRVDKQPGTLAVPLVIRIHLPNGARLESSSHEVAIEGKDLYLETDLRTDLDLEVELQLP